MAGAGSTTEEKIQKKESFLLDAEKRTHPNLKTTI